MYYVPALPLSTFLFHELIALFLMGIGLGERWLWHPCDIQRHQQCLKLQWSMNLVVRRVDALFLTDPNGNLWTSRTWIT